MAFFVTDSDCAYYLFGANDPDLRYANASSKLLIENIAIFAAQGLKRFDFVGVNSPQRGDFKLSFNAELVPEYFYLPEVFMNLNKISLGKDSKEQDPKPHC